jgi:hypothetical protein
MDRPCVPVVPGPSPVDGPSCSLSGRLPTDRRMDGNGGIPVVGIRRLYTGDDDDDDGLSWDADREPRGPTICRVRT